MTDHAELSRHPGVVERVGRIVEDRNRTLPSYARIKKFAVLPADFTEAGGELTFDAEGEAEARRRSRYGDVIESLYR